MDTQTADRLTELYLDYLDLGGDLMMLSGVVQDQSHDFSSECARACLRRLVDNVSQHTGDILKTSKARSPWGRSSGSRHRCGYG